MLFELHGHGPRLDLREDSRGGLGDALLEPGPRQRFHRRQPPAERPVGPARRKQWDDSGKALTVLDDQNPQLRALGAQMTPPGQRPGGR